MLDKRVFIIGGVVLVGLGVVAYIYYTRYRSKDSFTLETDTKPTVPDEQPKKKKPVTLVFFYADWCPHCETMMGEWQKTQQGLLGKVEAVSIESNNPDLRNFTIGGFPTIRLYPDGLDSDNYIDYTGPRKAENMIDFALNVQ